MANEHVVPTMGRLTTIDLREVWTSEPYAFTPWLAADENLQLLAETLDLPPLELIQTEKQVDIFSADIVARIAGTDETVLIENQIERSDHTHLGQVLTYAAGLDAAVIVWVTRRFTEGHRATLDWLNQITGERFAFFGVEVEALRIGESLPAPRFNVVSRPNAWTRQVRAAARSEDSATDCTEFWLGYEQVAQAKGAPTRKGAKPVRGTNYYVRIGDRGQIYLTAYRAMSKGHIGVYLSITGEGAGSIYASLLELRSDIEERFGEPLEWLPQRGERNFWLHAGRLATGSDEAEWPAQIDWLTDRMGKLESAVRESVQVALGTLEARA